MIQAGRDVRQASNEQRGDETTKEKASVLLAQFTPKLSTEKALLKGYHIMAISIDLSHVTLEQLERCTRIVHENTGEVFYKVESESDSTVEYDVRYDQAHHTFTCTCPAGLEGFKNCHRSRYCKHVTWSLAHAEEYRKEVAEQSQIESYVRQGIDRETACRVVYANSHPFRYTDLQVKMAGYDNQREPFSILR